MRHPLVIRQFETVLQSYQRTEISKRQTDDIFFLNYKNKLKCDMPGINGFPGSKLVLQLFRQMTKPVSTKLINFAKDHQGFKKHFLVIPGQYYHWFETMTKRYVQSDLSSTREVNAQTIREIKESKAMELGAELMIEVNKLLKFHGYRIQDLSNF